MLQLIIVTLASFGLGMLAGAVIIVRYYVARTKKPEVAQAMLKALYRSSHPHWLKDVETGSTVCPCCGWNETEGLASDQKCEGDRHR